MDDLKRMDVEEGKHGGSPCRQYCLTWPVYTVPKDEKSPETKLPNELFVDDMSYTCLVYQKERGTNTGYVHYQVAVSFTNKIRFNTLRTFLHSHSVRAWIGRVKGKNGWTKWKRYCSDRDKEGVFLDFPLFSVGDDAKQGQGRKKETDMELALQWITSDEHIDCTEKEFLMTFPNLCKAGNGNVYNYLMDMLRMPTERRRPLVYVFYGPTGTGKSAKAREYCKKNNLSFFMKTGMKWWNGYKGQDVVIFDEFRGQETDIPYYQLLQILDRFVFGVEIKGGVNMLKTQIFIFTSAFHPRDWYTGAQGRGDCYSQLERRITQITEFTRPYVHPEPDKKWDRRFMLGADFLPAGARVDLTVDVFEEEKKADIIVVEEQD